MAFNPVHYFRKYQRFWMAAVLLMCMITFVLCTGLSGDLGDFMLNLMRGRQKGAPICKIDGVTYYGIEMTELKNGRQAANTFMRKFCEKLKTTVEKRIEKMEAEKAPEAADKKLVQESVKAILEERLKRPRFFVGGVKLDDLVDFKIWLLEADRLKINLNQDAVFNLMAYEFRPRLTGSGNFYQDVAEVWQEVKAHGNVNIPSQKFLWQAIANEYRVEMAKLALLTYQEKAFYTNFREMPEAEQMRNRHFAALQLHPFEEGDDALRRPPFPFDTLRIPVSPAQMWEFFQEKRSEYNLDLVPVLASDYLKENPALIAANTLGLLAAPGQAVVPGSFAAQVTGGDGKSALPLSSWQYVRPPSEAELLAFFQEYRKKPYDPTAEEPGFQVPPRVSVEWITAGKECTARGKAMAALELKGVALPHPPLVTGFGTPLEVGFGSFVPYLIAPMVEKEILQKEFWRSFDDRPYATVPLTSSDYDGITDTKTKSDVKDLSGPLAYMGQNFSDVAPESLASLLGTLASPGGICRARYAFLATTREQVKDKDEYQRSLRVEARKRDEALRKLLETEAMDASLLMLAGQQTLAATLYRSGSEWANLARTPGYLAFKDEPPSFKLPDLRTKFEKKFIVADVQWTMQDLRKALMNDKVNGKCAAIEGTWEDKKREGLSFEVHKTSKAYDRFEIKLAPELKDFREAYDGGKFGYTMINMIEGRAGTEKAPLKETDFDKLFFDKSETFSSAQGICIVRDWPPRIMSSAERPADESIRAFNELKLVQGKQVPVDLFTMVDNPILFWVNKREEAYFPEKDKFVSADELQRETQEYQEKKQKLEEDLKGKNMELMAALDALRSKYDIAGKKDLRERVIMAWKINKAREEFARPAAQKIAEVLQNRDNKPADVWAQKEAAALHHRTIRLFNIAPMVPRGGFEFGSRAPSFSTKYTLPKDDLLLYPLDQMPQQLLMFGNPKSHLKTGYGPVDVINDELFKTYKASLEKKAKGLGQDRRLVQIFTNKPRDRFFVAVLLDRPDETGKLVGEPVARSGEFFDGYRSPSDRLILEAYNGIARDSYAAMKEELYKTKEVWITDDRKAFDSSE